MTRWTARDVRSLGVGLSYLAPSLFLFLAFCFIPLGRTIYLSLFNTRATGVITTFNGIDHYLELFTSPTFRFGVMPPARQRTQKMIESVLLGRESTQAALEAAVAEINAPIDKYNKANP